MWATVGIKWETNGYKVSTSMPDTYQLIQKLYICIYFLNKLIKCIGLQKL